jgi:succinate dehydrogenase flavin-adding protein (antitoxin of CptAB toxin-antitoxin module)
VIGKGLIYPLGLFLAHADRELCNWFCGVVDHLYEIKTDNIKDDKLKEKIDKFVDRCFELKDNEIKSMCTENNPSEDSKKEAIQDAKDILLELDKYYGNEAEKGDYE